MKSLVLVAFAAATLVVVHSLTPNDVLEEEWETFKMKYVKVYKNKVEEQFRRKIYIDNRHKIAAHNKKYIQGEVKFNMAMNAFGDMIHSEFVASRNGFKRDYGQLERNGSTFLRIEDFEAPDEVDWVKKGYVTDVKNQGDCGSCWSFSATGALEGQHMRKAGNLVSLSEQNLIDCSGKYGNEGCGGGLPVNAFQYVKENKGVDTEDSYPYEETEGTCRFNPSDVGATDTGYVDVESEDEDALKEAVATIGPVAAGIDANQPSFQFYSEGVYDEPKCSSEDLGHAILVVGYGTLEDNDFWLVKNSWGPEWGMGGYIRMSRNKDNQCGIATAASYPLV